MWGGGWGPPQSRSKGVSHGENRLVTFESAASLARCCLDPRGFFSPDTLEEQLSWRTVEERTKGRGHPDKRMSPGLLQCHWLYHPVGYWARARRK